MLKWTNYSIILKRENMKIYSKDFFKSTSLNEDVELIKSKYKRKIYLKEEPKNVDDVIIKLISLNNGTTYKRGGSQCSPGRYRSVVDIYKTCLTYFPDTKLEEVVNKLKVGDIPYGYCGTIKRYRLSFGNIWVNQYKVRHGIKD